MLGNSVFVGANNFSPLQAHIIEKHISFPQRDSSRLDIGCLPDIRCLGNPLFGEMQLGQTALALQKDIGCLRNIRCLKVLVGATGRSTLQYFLSPPEGLPLPKGLQSTNLSFQIFQSVLNKFENFKAWFKS